MNPAGMSAKQWETSDLSPDGRALLRCAAAAELSQAGRYDEAREALGELWLGLGERPRTAGLSALTAAEVHMRCGVLSTRLGAARKVSGAQERATDLLSEAARLFESAGSTEKVAEAQHELGRCHLRLGRYAEAHEHLDRAQSVLARPEDAGSLAQVDETRARVLLAERRYGEAGRVIEGAVRAFEAAGEEARLADALALQGVVRARLAAFEESLEILRRAMEVAEEASAPASAALAALCLIEEHGDSPRISEVELSNVYRRADELLKGTRDAEEIARLRACARLIIRRLSRVRLRDQKFSFYDAVHEMEERLIEQALEQEEGSLTRAARRLGLKHQSLSHMLRARHARLLGKRTPAIPRRRSIVKQREDAPEEPG